MTTARPTGTSPGHPPHRLEADRRLQLQPLSPGDLASLGIPELHATTGGDPRLVAESLANGHATTPSKTLTEALLASAAQRATGRIASWSHHPSSSSPSRLNRLPIWSAPTRSTSSLSLSACASDASSASTDSASAFATTSYARRYRKYLPGKERLPQQRLESSSSPPPRPADAECGRSAIPCM